MQAVRVSLDRSDVDGTRTALRELRAACTALEKTCGGARVKRFFGVSLGILTAIGGFVDIGDLVANSAVGARFGMPLAWVVVVGRRRHLRVRGDVRPRRGGQRPAGFDLVRERLGPRVGLVNLVGSFAITLLTLTAEIGGVALAIELATTCTTSCGSRSPPCSCGSCSGG